MWRLHPEAETEGFALELRQRRFSTAMVRKHPSVPRWSRQFSLSVFVFVSLSVVGLQHDEKRPPWFSESIRTLVFVALMRVWGRSAYDTSSRFVDFDRPAKETVGDCESFWGTRRGEDNFCPDCGTDAASCKDWIRNERCQPGSLFPLSSPLLSSLPFLSQICWSYNSLYKLFDKI
jgi:hypothetical protein